MPIRDDLADLARAHGFHAVRFAAVGPTPFADAVRAWVDAGHHADMDWLPRTLPERLDPRLRLAEARTAMVLAVDHAATVPPDPGGRTGRVARYAWGRDYHNLVGKRLRRLRRALDTAGIAAWGGVDTAPIVERAWSHAAGLGYTGKNCVQIIPARGSFLLLAVLFLGVDVPPDTPLARDHCGACTRCLVACPTDAFAGPRDLDARKCIAYWTIEAHHLPPRALRPAFGRWVFGCDVCQDVCPHNAAAEDGPEPDFAPRHAWLDLDALVQTPDDALMVRFLGTPLRRPGAAGLKRNALIVLGNLGDDGAVPAVRAALLHPSPVVRAAATWALGRLDALPARCDDPDPAVASEWRAAHDAIAAG